MSDIYKKNKNEEIYIKKGSILKALVKFFSTFFKKDEREKSLNTSQALIEFFSNSIFDKLNENCWHDEPPDSYVEHVVGLYDAVKVSTNEAIKHMPLKKEEILNHQNYCKLVLNKVEIHAYAITEIKLWDKKYFGKALTSENLKAPSREEKQKILVENLEKYGSFYFPWSELRKETIDLVYNAIKKDPKFMTDEFYAFLTKGELPKNN